MLRKMKKLSKILVLALCLVLIPTNVIADKTPYKNEIFCIESQITDGSARAGQPFVLKINLKNESKLETKGILALREIGPNKTNKFFQGGKDQEFSLKPGQGKDINFELVANEKLGNTAYPVTLSIKVDGLEMVDRIMLPVVSDTSTILPSSPDGQQGKIDIMEKLKDLPKEAKDKFLGQDDTGTEPAEQPMPNPEKPDQNSDKNPKDSKDKDPSKADNLDPKIGEDPKSGEEPKAKDPVQKSPGQMPQIDTGQISSMPDSAGFVDMPSIPPTPPMPVGNLGGDTDFTNDGGLDLSGEIVKNKPKLIIDKYSFQPEHPLAGEDFKMNLSFYNTNADKSVRNIKIFLTSNDMPANQGDGAGLAAGSSVFTPVGSSNTFFIDSIEPKGTVNKSVVLTTAPTIASKNYTLMANFEYEDKDGNQYVAQELIGIPVTQESKLTTSKVTMMGEGFIGMPVDGEIQFYNTGKDTLYNLMVSVEGDFEEKSLEEYIGNFQSGDSSSYMFNVVPSEAGNQKGKIVLTYEDATGKNRTVEEDFVVQVSEDDFIDPEMDMMDQDIEEVKPGLNNIPLPLIIGGVVVGLAIVAAVLQRRKRKKEEKEMTIDED